MLNILRKCKFEHCVNDAIANLSLQNSAQHGLPLNFIKQVLNSLRSKNWSRSSTSPTNTYHLCLGSYVREVRTAQWSQVRFHPNGLALEKFQFPMIVRSIPYLKQLKTKSHNEGFQRKSNFRFLLYEESLLVLTPGVSLGVFSLRERHNATYNGHMSMNELHTAMQPAGPWKAPCEQTPKTGSKRSPPISPPG